MNRINIMQSLTQSRKVTTDHGHGKNGNVRKGALLGRNIKVEINNERVSLNRKSLINYLNAQIDFLNQQEISHEEYIDKKYDHLENVSDEEIREVFQRVHEELNKLSNKQEEELLQKEGNYKHAVAFYLNAARSGDDAAYLKAKSTCETILSLDEDLCKKHMAGVLAFLDQCYYRGAASKLEGDKAFKKVSKSSSIEKEEKKDSTDIEKEEKKDPIDEMIGCYTDALYFFQQGALLGDKSSLTAAKNLLQEMVPYKEHLEPGFKKDWKAALRDMEAKCQEYEKVFNPDTL